MNIKYAKDNLKLEWGEVTQEDILRRIFREKSLKEMNDQEIVKMLDDFF